MRDIKILCFDSFHSLAYMPVSRVVSRFVRIHYRLLATPALLTPRIPIATTLVSPRQFWFRTPNKIFPLLVRCAIGRKSPLRIYGIVEEIINSTENSLDSFPVGKQVASLIDTERDYAGSDILAVQ